jgi:hypothetical protein
MGSEALATGRNMLTDMADPNVKLRDVVRRNVSESKHKVIKRLSRQVRIRKRATSAKRGKQSSRCKKRKKNIKRDIFS